MKKNVRPFKVWLGPLLFIKILLKTAQLLSEHFPSNLLLCIPYFLFHKGKDTSAIPQPSVRYLVYVFSIFCRFHKFFNNFHLSKNILINKVFHWNQYTNISRMDWTLEFACYTNWRGELKKSKWNFNTYKWSFGRWNVDKREEKHKETHERKIELLTNYRICLVMERKLGNSWIKSV